jgi:hypothetical protein
MAPLAALICRECLNIASGAVKPWLAGEGRFASRLAAHPDTSRGYDGYLPYRIVCFPEARRGQRVNPSQPVFTAYFFYESPCDFLASIWARHR